MEEHIRTLIGEIRNISGMIHARQLYNDKVKEENSETLDIFEPAMHNLYDTASVVIDAMLEGRM